MNLMATKRIQTVFLFALLAVSVYFGSTFALSAQAQSEGVNCSMPFEATVYAGPSTGTSLVGTLSFTFDEEGGITGTLEQDGQPEILVLGQADGRAINLVFDLSTLENPGVFIFGVGTAIDPVDSELCGTVSGGPFVGPGKGDSGDWLAGGSTGSNAAKGAPMSNSAQDSARLFGTGDAFEADNKKKQESAKSKLPTRLFVQPTGFLTRDVQPTGFLTGGNQPGDIVIIDAQPTGFSD
jgi:hypothetical protein